MERRNIGSDKCWRIVFNSVLIRVLIRTRISISLVLFNLFVFVFVEAIQSWQRFNGSLHTCLTDENHSILAFGQCPEIGLGCFEWQLKFVSK